MTQDSPAAINGFAPVAREDAKVLILGSMPGIPSLNHNQYYANPRNAFWPIMAQLFEFPLTLNYVDRLKRLTENNVAVWDVIASCTRPGSLDANIDSKSVVTNDFKTFLQRYQNIKCVVCNGARAHQDFVKLVVPNLSDINFELHKLLSTSPANARYTVDQKLANWRIIQSYL